MSDVTTGSIFNPQFFMNPPWWLGRVEEKETWNDNIEGENFTNLADIKGWGHRYKVRIFNWHTGELDKLPPKDMAFCQVVMPVTAGSGHGSETTTPSIESGSVVFGFFMDGMAGQEGYIMGVLGNSNNNVPKKRGESAPNQPTRTPTGTSTPSTPPTGPGSLSQIPLSQIPNVDGLSTAQLNKLLDPSKTASSAVSKVVNEAKQKARAAGLPAAEVTRLGQVATVKASRQPSADAGSAGNCNQGYQQFGDTYTDGDEMRSAKVPADRIVGNTPLSITEALHIETLAKIEQYNDSNVNLPLEDVCKEGNSEIKGIQRVIQNLLNSIESLKRKFNQASAFASDVSEFANEIQIKVLGAIEELSRYLKNILTSVRGFVLKTLADAIKKIAPFLFPSEGPKLDTAVEKGLDLINCLFNRLIEGLKSLLAGLFTNILDQFINAPLCAVENFLSNFLDSILGPIVSVIDSIFGSIGSLFGSVLSGISQISSALDFISGILQFFSCDESKDCVPYSEVSQSGLALPGIDIPKLNLPPPGNNVAPECPTGPQLCGPPSAKIFGGGGNGAAVNPIISPISSSVIGFDIINPGSGFLTPPSAVLVDPCGNGNGASLQVNLEDETGTGGTGTGTGGTGTPVTAGGTPVTAGGTGGTPVTAGGTGGTPVTAGGTGGTPVTAGGRPVTAGGRPVTAGGTGGTPVTAGGKPVTVNGIGGTPITVGGTRGTSLTAGGRPVTVGGRPVTAGGIIECDVPRNSFENTITNKLNITKRIKNITIRSPGNGYLAAPNGSFGGGGRVWKESDEGYVRTRCGGYFVVQPYRPIAVKPGDTYYPPDGPSRVIKQDEIITLPLVPITPPKPESLGITYPVILSIEEIKVLDNGFGYRPGDKLIITPDNGTETELVINEFGNIESVKILKSGYGFLDFPEIRTDSPTGFNATFTPIFKSTRLEDFNKDNMDNLELGNIPIINVVDCVGRVN
jgi:hypothetical protein